MNQPPMSPRDAGLQGFLGLVALCIVGRDRAEDKVPGQDFRQRLRHWLERMEADPQFLTDSERMVFDRIVDMLLRRIEITDVHWDDFQSWPLPPSQDK